MSKGRSSKSISMPNEGGESALDLRRGPWTHEEDNLLIDYITCNGEGRWNTLAKCAGLNRTGKSCRLRWLNYLKPDIKRGNLTPQEQLLILELHSKWGNRWSKIAQHLPGRTDNEIKNYWRTRVQKQARQLNVDSNSKKFLEAIRRSWMPRLLEKVEQSSTASSSSSISSSSISTIDNNHDSAAPSVLTNQIPFPASSSPILTDTSDFDMGKSYKSSSDLVRIMQLPADQIENNSSNPVQYCGKDSAYNSMIKDECYQVGMTRYDTEVSTTPQLSAMESQNLTFSECEISETDWLQDVIPEPLWNMDELIMAFQKTRGGHLGCRF